MESFGLRPLNDGFWLVDFNGIDWNLVMKKWYSEPEVWVIGYIVMMFITFGNAYHRVPDTEEKAFAGQMYTVHNGVGTKAVGAMLSSIFWPLYWSVQVQR
jgi:hypothetical protein